MNLWSNQSLAALLLASTLATPAIAAAPYTGCPAGYHRAEAEGGGVGSVNAQTRKAGEAGGVGSVNAQTRKAGEAGGVGSVNAQTSKAESEGGGVGSVNAQTRKAEALAQMPCVENK
ncbi:MAG TPA: hypothetical protein VK822_19875 [Acetobacteraceae bacterium]|jgi:hypothetical protein|nr:hypothetical protein [Acetobacteraceae bacterium]